jgi:putative ABC transport system permease protein
MKNNTPPKFFLNFFRWFCHPKLLKYIEGDLMELYEERKGKSGKFKADALFVKDVLLLFRPSIIKPADGYQKLNTYGMYKSYFKIGWRALLRNKGYSFINIVGLATGMAVTMLIGMWIADEVSFNTNHDNYDRIAQVYQHQTFNNEVSTRQEVPVPLSQELKTTYKDDFKQVVRVSWSVTHILSVDDQKINQLGTYMDPEALELFSFKMQKGSHSSLKDPSSIILSESAANALFGDLDPINKLVRIDNQFDVKVTGVFEDFPDNSQFHSLRFISTWQILESENDWVKADENNWSSSALIFVELQPGVSFDAVSAKIENIRAVNLNKERAAQESPRLFLHPMSQWHLYSEWKNGEQSGGRIQFVWLFGIIGSFVLVLACINFMNLSTAQSERRAKEVGIRKSIGSLRTQLILQFLSESFLVVLFAFIMSIVFVTLALPWFNNLAEKRMNLPLDNIYFWLISISFIFVTSLLAGSYPALYLSSIKPLKALKGVFKADRSASLPRQVLVVLQFTVSIMLIVSTIVVWKQIQFVKDRPVGYTREGLIMIRKTSPEFYGKFNVLRNKLKEANAITEMAESSSPATESWFHTSGFNWKGKDPNLHDEFATVSVTFNYGKTMGWTFVQGRDYSKEFSTDSSAVILNEAAVRFMGLDDPIDEEISWRGKKFKVIGVIKDMIMDSPYQQAGQTIFWMNYEDEGKVWTNIRLNPLLSVSEAISKIEKVFQAVIPSVPFDFKFVDQEYALKFSSEERTGQLANLFSVLAIFISCMGLFGMASFVAEQRKKEIGVRKILGASVPDLWKLLSSEFILLVIISCVVGIPIANYFLKQWLQQYEYRTEVSWWIFLVTITGAITITLLTVSFQTIKAAMGDPVKSLRSE